MSYVVHLRQGTRRASHLRTRAVGLATLVALAVTALSTARAQAASFSVTTTTDAAAGGLVDCTVAGHQCTLRAAIQAADTAGGSSTISVPAGHYILSIPPSGGDDITTGDLNVTANLTIQGAGAATTIIDAGGSPTTITDRVFAVARGTGALTMSGVTVQNGHPANDHSGGGILASGPLTLTDVVVTGNTVTHPSGTSGLQRTFGGGIQQGCATNSGCGTTTGDPISLTRVTLSNNAVISPVDDYNAAGALMENDGYPVVIIDSTITGNSAPQGGAIVEDGGSTITIQGSTLAGNHATATSGTSIGQGSGGAIESTGGGTVVLTNDTLSGNSAPLGGGALFDDGADTYSIIGTTFSGNTANASGGSGAGGAMFINSGGPWTITNSTFVANSGAGPGQAIANLAGTNFGSAVRLRSDTIDGNGGGAGAQLSNSGPSSGHGSLALTDTIVNGGAGTACSGAGISSGGFNLVSDSSCGFAGPGDLVAGATGLGPPSANGGPTQTEALLTGSPALDAGGTSCPATDQRGVPRPDQAGGQCDIGAVEMSVSSGGAGGGGGGSGSGGGSGGGGGGAGQVPANLAAPAITGTPLPGQKLTCAPGTWSGAPSLYAYRWSRGSALITAATGSTYTVAISDAAQVLRCTVTAFNATGPSAPQASAATLVAYAGTLGCPKPSGRLHGAVIGTLALGMTRVRARRTLRRYTVRQNRFDDFCLFAGFGIRAGYPTPTLLRSVARSRRAQLTGRIILALTANPFYSVAGVRPGATATAAARRIHAGKPLRIGANDWYVGGGSSAAVILKVQRGTVLEIGIADRALTTGRASQRRLLASFGSA